MYVVAVFVMFCVVVILVTMHYLALETVIWQRQPPPKAGDRGGNFCMGGRKAAQC